MGQAVGQAMGKGHGQLLQLLRAQRKKSPFAILYGNRAKGTSSYSGLAKGPAIEQGRQCDSARDAKR